MVFMVLQAGGVRFVSGCVWEEQVNGAEETKGLKAGASVFIFFSNEGWLAGWLGKYRFWFRFLCALNFSCFPSLLLHMGERFS